MAKHYIVTLDTEEREMLYSMINSGTERARKLTHARILLKADEGWKDKDICKALDVGIATLQRVRKRFVLEGLEAALNRRCPRRDYSRKLDGEQEARLVAVACSSPPEGSARWSLRLLADRVVQLKIVDSVSHETIRQVLNNNELKPWLREEWCIPPEANAKFVYHSRMCALCVSRSSKAAVSRSSPKICVQSVKRRFVMTIIDTRSYNVEQN